MLWNRTVILMLFGIRSLEREPSCFLDKWRQCKRMSESWMFQTLIFSPLDTSILLDHFVCWRRWEWLLWEILPQRKMMKSTLGMEAGEWSGPTGLLITSFVTWSWLLTFYLHLVSLICKTKVGVPFLFTSQCLKIEEIKHTKLFEHSSRQHCKVHASQALNVTRTAKSFVSYHIFVWLSERFSKNNIQTLRSALRETVLTLIEAQIKQNDFLAVFQTSGRRRLRLSLCGAFTVCSTAQGASKASPLLVHVLDAGFGDLAGKCFLQLQPVS